jgi:hypothetical protein
MQGECSDDRNAAEPADCAAQDFGFQKTDDGAGGALIVRHAGSKQPLQVHGTAGLDGHAQSGSDQQVGRCDRKGSASGLGTVDISLMNKNII